MRFEADDAPTDPTRQAHWPADAAPDSEVTVTAGGTSFRTRRGRPLLDALEDQGVRPKAACRSGECGLCRVRILKSTVHIARSRPRRARNRRTRHRPFGSWRPRPPRRPPVQARRSLAHPQLPPTQQSC
ncbi:2Fe-2S iron-sulfur cluster-binding protein [Streptomyces platensis]|uniref:2Fe-2S iron-sulfur cluster-binding protein n=1 Tax=Streptomyces platensis TaxID=58346 RepID=UPI0037A9396F